MAPGLGPAPAGVEDRQRRVIGEQLGRGQHGGDEQVVKGAQPPSCPADPVGQGRAVEGDAEPGVYLRLTVERQVITEFADDDVSQQRLGGHAAGDRTLGRRRLDHAFFTRSAGVFGRVDRLDPELGRHDVEHFPDILAHGVKRAATARAGLVLDIDRDIDPGQIDRQGASIAPRFGGPGLARRLFRGRGGLAGGLGRADGLLQVFESQLQLVGVELFGTGAIKGAPQLLNQIVQLLDLGRRLGMLCLEGVALGPESIPLGLDGVQFEARLGGLGQCRDQSGSDLVMVFHYWRGIREHAAIILGSRHRSRGFSRSAGRGRFFAVNKPWRFFAVSRPWRFFAVSRPLGAALPGPDEPATSPTPPAASRAAPPSASSLRHGSAAK